MPDAVEHRPAVGGKRPRAAKHGSEPPLCRPLLVEGDPVAHTDQAREKVAPPVRDTDVSGRGPDPRVGECVHDLAYAVASDDRVGVDRDEDIAVAFLERHVLCVPLPAVPLGQQDTPSVQ